jgi:hypothetical protein
MKLRQNHLSKLKQILLRLDRASGIFTSESTAQSTCITLDLRFCSVKLRFFFQRLFGRTNLGYACFESGFMILLRGLK